MKLRMSITCMGAISSGRVREIGWVRAFRVPQLDFINQLSGTFKGS